MSPVWMRDNQQKLGKAESGRKQNENDGDARFGCDVVPWVAPPPPKKNRNTNKTTINYLPDTACKEKRNSLRLNAMNLTLRQNDNNDTQ